MPLTNAQYDAVLRLYNQRQLRNRRELDQRRRNAYRALPRLAQLDQEAASISMKKARILLGKGEEQIGQDFDLPSALEKLSRERQALLQSAGLPKDYLDLRYDCPFCQDTGFVNGRKCVCFRQAETKVLYEESNLQNIPPEDNFRNFSLDYYSDTLRSESNGLTARETAALALRHSRDFVSNFSHSFENLCFYGDTGVGKTFLSHCIARELMDGGYSVLYLTAFDFFRMLEQGKFASAEESQAAYHQLFDCDLLIVDDLGTELTNSFVSSQLFLCVNHRILMEKSTIISTNLSLERFADTYSERTFSRILSYYKMIRLFGHDIRIQKQLSGGSNHAAN
jgi:DNA replication protein DnaC